MNYWEFVSNKFTFIGPILTKIGCNILYGKASPKIYLHRKDKPSKFILDMLLYKANKWRVYEIKKKYLKLEFFMNIMFEQDEMIGILESQLFGTKVYP